MLDGVRGSKGLQHDDKEMFTSFLKGKFDRKTFVKVAHCFPGNLYDLGGKTCQYFSNKSKSFYLQYEEAKLVSGILLHFYCSCEEFLPKSAK